MLAVRHYAHGFSFVGPNYTGFPNSYPEIQDNSSGILTSSESFVVATRTVPVTPSKITQKAPRSPVLAIKVSAQDNVTLGKQIALEQGIDGKEWECFYRLIQKESGWNSEATNKSSGAYGLPQALPASKLDTYGNRHDPIVQLNWAFDYIENRYDTPCKALQFQTSHTPNWY